MSLSERRQVWFSHLEAWRASGLSQAGYCRLHGLKPSTFSYWLLRDRVAADLPNAVATPFVAEAVPNLPNITPAHPSTHGALPAAAPRDFAYPAPLTLAAVTCIESSASPPPIAAPFSAAPAFHLTAPNGWALQLPSSISPQWLGALLRALS